jgi:hypothetical protein
VSTEKRDLSGAAAWLNEYFAKMKNDPKKAGAGTNSSALGTPENSAAPEIECEARLTDPNPQT